MLHCGVDHCEVAVDSPFIREGDSEGFIEEKKSELGQPLLASDWGD